MQIVVHVGGTAFNNRALLQITDQLHRTIKATDNQLALISSMFDSERHQESLIRKSDCMDQVNEVFVIITTLKKAILITSCKIDTKLEMLDDPFVMCLCNGTLSDWKSTVVRLINNQETNPIGQLILNQLGKLGYSGIFHEYARTKDDKGHLMLEYRDD